VVGQRGSQLIAGGDAEFWENAVQVRADRPVRQEQTLTYLAVGQTLRGQLGDLDFLRRKQLARA
jgi:hypothetical protein